MKRPTMLMIMDGLGLTEEVKGNAVKAAKTLNLDRLMKEYPFVQGQASGLHVGLPDGQMGNSEVGHMNMGAGRIVYQDLTRITKDIEDGGFFRNEALLAAMKKAANNESFAYTEDEVVSCDVVGITAAALFDATQTMVIPINDELSEVQIISWYDNEYSYTSQMVRTIKYFSELQ